MASNVIVIVEKKLLPKSQVPLFGTCLKQVNSSSPSTVCPWWWRPSCRTSVIALLDPTGDRHPLIILPQPCLDVPLLHPYLSCHRRLFDKMHSTDCDLLKPPLDTFRFILFVKPFLSLPIWIGMNLCSMCLYLSHVDFSQSIYPSLLQWIFISWFSLEQHKGWTIVYSFVCCFLCPAPKNVSGAFWCP